jgi:hypothetical protein
MAKPFLRYSKQTRISRYPVLKDQTPVSRLRVLRSNVDGAIAHVTHDLGNDVEECRARHVLG